MQRAIAVRWRQSLVWTDDERVLRLKDVLESTSFVKSLPFGAYYDVLSTPAGAAHHGVGLEPRSKRSTMIIRPTPQCGQR
jgi:hypothetical protein